MSADVAACESKSKPKSTAILKTTYVNALKPWLDLEGQDFLPLVLETGGIGWRVDRISEDATLSALRSLIGATAIHDFVPETIVLLWNQSPEIRVVQAFGESPGPSQKMILADKYRGNDISRPENGEIVRLVQYVATCGRPSFRPGASKKLSASGRLVAPILIEIEVDFSVSMRSRFTVEPSSHFRNPFPDSESLREDLKFLQAMSAIAPCEPAVPLDDASSVRAATPDGDPFRFDLRPIGYVDEFPVPSSSGKTRHGEIERKRSQIVRLLERVKRGKYSSELDHPWGIHFPKLTEVDRAVFELSSIDFGFFGSHEAVETAIDMLHSSKEDGELRGIAAAAADLTVALEMFGDAGKGYNRKEAVRSARILFRKAIHNIK